ncbi:MAG: FKBP-type peptidyl-prolyl cis-trans isomerase [Thiohalomonadaceae bacterium]
MFKHSSKFAVLFLCAGISLSAIAKQDSKNLDTFSYALGVSMADSIKQRGMDDIDIKAMSQGIADILGDKELKYSFEEMQAAYEWYGKKQAAAQTEMASKAKAAGDKFRADNKKKKGVKELPNGIQYQEMNAGKGQKPKLSDTITVHYHGTLINGEVFDSSVARNEPATFPLNRVIPGWQEVLPMMQIGAKWRVVIPPDLAYGEQGSGGPIGPNETLIFEIELLSIDN